MIPERIRSPEQKKIFPWSHGEAELDWIPGVRTLTVLCAIPFLEGEKARKQPNTHSFQTKTVASSSCFQLPFYWIDFWPSLMGPFLKGFWKGPGAWCHLPHYSRVSCSWVYQHKCASGVRVVLSIPDCHHWGKKTMFLLEGSSM